jgi:periplasmic divalent cation tolerance protein
MDDATGEILVITTVGNSDQARILARSVVESHLAACATCLPGGISFFRWQSDSISEESEVVLLIKTHRDRLEALENHFKSAHPYEVPEILVFEAAAISHSYAAWLRTELQLNPEVP